MELAAKCFLVLGLLFVFNFISLQLVGIIRVMGLQAKSAILELVITWSLGPLLYYLGIHQKFGVEGILFGYETIAFFDDFCKPVHLTQNERLARCG